MKAPSDEQDGNKDKAGLASGDKFFIPCGDKDMRRG
jgi:hypothetical protein